MIARGLTPILNVSDIRASFAWFEKLGWTKGWEWGDPPSFGGVCSGECEVFLCRDAQGGRGRRSASRTFGPDGDEIGDKGAWMSVWVDDVDAVHQDLSGAGPRRDLAAHRHALACSRDAPAASRRPCIQNRSGIGRIVERLSQSR